MSLIKLTKTDLSKELGEKILFFHIAEGGAMGEPGGVVFITDDNDSYTFNYMFGNITIQDVKEFFPPLKRTWLGWHGQGNAIPDEWQHMYLGCGNHLLISDKVYKAFFEIMKNIPRISDRYGKWEQVAKTVIANNIKNEKIIQEESKMSEVKKGNGITEIVFILDRSGSMSGYESDVVGGFNATIEKQCQEAGTALVSVILFDNVSDVIYDRVNLEDVRPMTIEDYQVRGCTALIDALGGAIHHIGNVHKYARNEDVPEHTIFVINSDGMENASHRYSSRKVKEMIQRQTEKYGWEFIFLAANIDAVKTAEDYGIRKERAVRFEQSLEGIEKNYCMMSKAIKKVRNCETLDDEDWKND